MRIDLNACLCLAIGAGLTAFLVAAFILAL